MWNLFKVNNKDTDVVVVSWLFILNKFRTCSDVYIVDLEQVSAGWAQFLIWQLNVKFPRGKPLTPLRNVFSNSQAFLKE